MKTIEIKDINGVVLFVHTVKNNSIKITVEEAVKKNVNLLEANLTNAKLKGVNFKGANLYWVDLEGANLEGADLEGTYLKGANLNCVNFEDANLEGANLEGADLTGANFEGANLEGTYLKGANLAGANFKGANLEGANLEGANLDGAKNIPYIPLACPSEGAFIGWKKVDGKYLVKIHIPEDAKRLSGTTKKCRCNKAMVLDITSLDGETHFDEVVNNNYKKTIYKAGKMVYPDSFDENRWRECSHGIHFFVDKKDTIEY